MARGTGQLEHDVPAVVHDPGADFGQILAQRGERSVRHLTGQRKVERWRGGRDAASRRW